MRLIDVDKTYEVLTEFYHHKTEAQHDALKEALGKVPVALELFDLLPREWGRSVEWHLEHKRLGFSDPFADVYEALMGKEDDDEPLREVQEEGH